MYEKGKGNPPQTEHTLRDRPYSRTGARPRGWKPLYRGEDVSRYRLARPTEFVHYGEWLAAPRTTDLFESPKILMRRTDDRLMACLEKDSGICVNSCHVIRLSHEVSFSYEYLLGLLNSRLLQWIFEIQNPQMVGKVFAEVKVVYVERLPIRVISVGTGSERAVGDRLTGLVRRRVSLEDVITRRRTEQEKDDLERQVAALDRQIDQLVYELYGLTDEEIRIVEEATS